MAWILAVASLIAGIKNGVDSLVIAAPLFWIAGSISYAATILKGNHSSGDATNQ